MSCYFYLCIEKSLIIFFPCLHLSALIVSLSSGGRAAAFHCLNVLHPIETNCWRKIIHLTSWQEAQSYCRENHTDLISGTKQIEDEEVKKLMNSSDSKSYIGLFRDTWRWSDGSSFSFRHWNKNFNNSKSVSGQCAMTVFEDGGRWKNVNCAERKPFICYDGE
uniref:C-type lectin domain-containing protein n=1 Tax=Poecilia latipinna TaxID=48699 RepID=A0A3B3UVS8_9TELE